MSEAVTLPSLSEKSQSPTPLSCKIRRIEAMGRHGPLTNMGEVELENCSAAPLEIEYTMAPLQYLDMEVIEVLRI